MRKSISILAIVAALFMVFSCQKESTTVLRATINQYNGNDGKAYLAANDYVNWHVGDQLWVNGQLASVTGTTSPFTIEVVDLDATTETFYAVYPKANSTMSGNSARVTIPAEQTYTTDDQGRQIINAPMAAKQVKAANGVTTLMFYNLASLFEIELPTNAVDATIKSIDVYNVANNFGGAAINGTADVNFDDNGAVTMSAVSGGTHVTKLEVNATHVANRKYYVVVAPVSDAQFQVVVNYETASHNLGVAQVKQNGTNNILPANMIAPITLTNANSYDPYVSDGEHAYYVAPGNVQCYVDYNLPIDAPEGTPIYRYRFAAHQWEMYGGSNLRSDGTGNLAFPIDLFPWGQTGNPEARTFPTAHRTDMVDFVDNGGHIPCDFEIGDDDLEWRIPHQDPAVKVFTKRGGDPGNGQSVNMAFGQDASVCTIHVGTSSYKGVIVLPDNYPGAHFEVGDGSWQISISAEQWLLMESLGASFLPCAGQIYKEGGVYKWSGTHSDGMAFYTLKDPFNGNSVHYFIFADSNDPAYITPRTGAEHARSFRLIRPAPGITPESSLPLFTENLITAPSAN